MITFCGIRLYEGIAFSKDPALIDDYFQSIERKVAQISLCIQQILSDAEKTSSKKADIVSLMNDSLMN